MVGMTIGERVKIARQQNGLSQSQLANRMGVSQARISNWEAGKAPLAQEWISKLEAILGPGLSKQSMQTTIGGPSRVASWLSRAREQAGLTPAELAKKAGLSTPTIYNIESRRAEFPRDKTIRLLERALGTRFDPEAARELREASEIEGLGDFEDFNPHEQKDWPDKPGVYVFYDISERPVYVGQSKSMATRMRSHQDRFWFKRPIVETGSYIPIEDERLRKQVETILVKFLKSNAVLNQQQVERD